MEDINNFLSKVFPVEDINCLLPLLVELGASSMEDLQFLNVETDLPDVLPPLKRQKLEAALACSKSSPVQLQCGCLIGMLIQFIFNKNYSIFSSFFIDVT